MYRREKIDRAKNELSGVEKNSETDSKQIVKTKNL